MLVPENEASGHRTDDETVVSGGLRLVTARVPPEVPADGMLLDTGNCFGRLLEQWADVEATANGSKEDDGNTPNRAPPGSARRPGCRSTGLSAAGDHQWSSGDRRPRQRAMTLPPDQAPKRDPKHR